MKLWLEHFDERQVKEIQLSRIYEEQFHHGTDGHNARMIIAKMASLLDEYQVKLGPGPTIPPPIFEPLDVVVELEK